ncbi:hypothetical protein AC579_10453 [Pseudocercospora musae]|uniref:Uncharacterized protein n=1 Tax=Pseudocercospora musae TaxID=113226 RepID=A0A139IDS3_9PEZI|nr:hypothetical protein AC579_10453 [Pseudocercospora musae]
MLLLPQRLVPVEFRELNWPDFGSSIFTCSAHMHEQSASFIFLDLIAGMKDDSSHVRGKERCKVPPTIARKPDLTGGSGNRSMPRTCVLVAQMSWCVEQVQRSRSVCSLRAFSAVEYVQREQVTENGGPARLEVVLGLPWKVQHYLSDRELLDRILLLISRAPKCCCVVSLSEQQRMDNGQASPDNMIRVAGETPPNQRVLREVKTEGWVPRAERLVVAEERNAADSAPATAPMRPKMEDKEDQDNICMETEACKWRLELVISC